jgi:anti-sigma factor RsiW
MTPHLSEEQAVLYPSRSLAAIELLQVSHHLAECEACRGRIASPTELYAGVEGFRAVLDAEAANLPHLTYEEIAAYVDQHVAGEDAAEIEKHVRNCTSCAAELSEIESVRREIEAPRKSPRWLDRMASLWRETFAWKGTFALAGVAACALLVLVVVRKPVSKAPEQQATAKSQQTGIATAPGGTLAELNHLPVALRASLTQAMTSQQIERPSVLDDLAGKRGVLLGESTAPSGVQLLDPLGVVVESQKPTLRWKPIAGAEYRVSVYSDGYDEVATGAWTSDAEWQVPKALKRGLRYSWQISVRHNGAEFTVPVPPAPEARFKVLDAAGEAEIAQLKTGGTDSHMLLGIRYAQLGALDEAERELRQAREQGPDSSTAAALLSNVERLRITNP